MPGKIPRYLTQIAFIIFAIWVGALLSAPALASDPGWENVPQHLKNQQGVQQAGEYFYVTAMVQAKNSVRPDKTHEVARKKSLLRALQILYIESICSDLLTSIGLKEQDQFVHLLTSMAPGIHVQGLTVIRQWEKGQKHFTAIAVPLTAIKDIPCKFPDLSSVISHYIELDQVAIESLAFCLRNASRYSSLNKAVRKRIGRFYHEKGQKALSLCFIQDQSVETKLTTLQQLSLQNSIYHATQLTSQAEGFAAKGQWNKVLDLTSQALDLALTHARAYLLLSDYLQHELKKPGFALCAVEKAMRDGTLFYEGLSRVVSILREMNSQEAEIFHFLLSQCKTEKNGCDYKWPMIWKDEIKKLTDTQIPYLIPLSLGMAVQGNSGQPGAEFRQALALFEQAGNDADVGQALELLIQECEKQSASAITYNLIGACYRNLGKPSFALPFFWQALTLKPEYDYALTNLGLCCQSLGVMKSASYYFDQKAVKASHNNWVQESYDRFYQTIK